MTPAAVIAAWLALGLAAASLSWQIVSWLRTGARLRVHGDDGFMIGPRGNRPFKAVSVVNDGRAAAEISQLGFRLPNGKCLVSPDGGILRPTTLPATAKALGGEVDMWFDPDELARACEKHGCEVRDLVPYARSGSRTITGKWKKRAL